jgi:putative toxin-antitoxin system antitoxin component (TIGR02293 family)
MATDKKTKTEIFAAATKLFDGDEKAARRWLTSPVYGLNGARPIDVAKSAAGAIEVRDLIGRLEDGIPS